MPYLRVQVFRGRFFLAREVSQLQPCGTSISGRTPLCRRFSHCSLTPCECEGVSQCKAPHDQGIANKGGYLSKCSATLASVAAPPPGARQAFGGPNCLRHPSQVAVLHRPLPRAKIGTTGGSGIGCDRALWGGCSCDTLATHSKLWKELRRGCSCTVERDRGGGGSVFSTKEDTCGKHRPAQPKKIGQKTCSSLKVPWLRPVWLFWVVWHTGAEPPLSRASASSKSKRLRKPSWPGDFCKWLFKQQGLSGHVWPRRATEICKICNLGFGVSTGF